ncbi:hypothetical protein K402DRAFT_392077 [Aulographum hederae CBS 113979]|uniref:PDZ GRASP-type domain-containing protein n=1 Tax=Aulographum hederae CBS 113979 TaxID=1176131 RepID=A0A6G1H593_9PEZI|nr:hypothetical protein K402DRAFT_392077 [Aulographum hederae CBS 113979]
MFGALNRFISRLDDAPSPHTSSGQSGAGFQILRNKSPDVPLEPWFDFIIGINGHSIETPNSNLFATEVRNCAGSTVSFGVWSAKGQKIREIYIPIPPSGDLGLSLQWTPLSATEDVWHILDVTPNSPADLAGLLPYGDYVIGSPEGMIKGEAGLGELVEEYLNRPLRLQIYNHEYNLLRPITITPSRTWGGAGALGCVLGFGALHRIPAPLSEPPNAPGEVLFAGADSTDGGYKPFDASDEKRAIADDLGMGAVESPMPPAGEGGFLVPANMNMPPPPNAAGIVSPPPKSPSPGLPPKGPPRSTKKARAHHAISPSAGLDDYFKEGEEKSRELDYGGGSTKGAGFVPPPPRMGGPPAGVKKEEGVVGEEEMQDETVAEKKAKEEEGDVGVD